MRILLAFICVTIMMTAAPAVMAQDVSIAVVDIEKLLNESKAGQSIAKQIEAKQESFQKEFSKKEKDLVDSQKKLIEEKKDLSAEEFAAKRKEFEEKLIETRKLFQSRRTDLDRALSDGLKKLRQSVIEVTAAMAEEKGYQAVLTRDSVVIVDKKLDITDQVLSRLNDKIDNIQLSL